MKKTISVKMNDDDWNKIDQYCDNNSINKNDLIKRSLKNITEPTPGNQTPGPTAPKSIQELSIKKAIEELDNKKKSESEIRKQALNDFEYHLQNKNCIPGNCTICDKKYTIQNIAKNQQEEKDSKLLDKTYKQFKQKENTAYQNGIINGISTMNQHKDRKPKDVYDFVIKKSLSPQIR